nr:ubiquitin fusion degradation protein UFD1 [Tanacetum cinerariifolium]
MPKHAGLIQRKKSVKISSASAEMAPPVVYFNTLPMELYMNTPLPPQVAPRPMFMDHPLHVKILSQIEYYFRCNTDSPIPVYLGVIIYLCKTVKDLTTDVEKILDSLKNSSSVEIQIEAGNKIMLPPSVLDELVYRGHVVYPMTFCIKKADTELHSHCGVIEFTADEGVVFMPKWMMENMKLQDGEVDEKYLIDIVETKPSSHAIALFDTDYEVDFATPLNFKEHEKKTMIFTRDGESVVEFMKKLPIKESNKQQTEFTPFMGQARRFSGQVVKVKENDGSKVQLKKKEPEELKAYTGKSYRLMVDGWLSARISRLSNLHERIHKKVGPSLMEIRAYVAQEQECLLELVDPSLGRYSKDEAMRLLNIALLCTIPSPTLRPPMSSVVKMLDDSLGPRSISTNAPWAVSLLYMDESKECSTSEKKLLPDLYDVCGYMSQ